MNKNIEFFNKHKGEIFISPELKLVRLIGILEDEYDTFYILLTNKCKVIYSSVVLPLYELKHKIDNPDYNDLVTYYKFNHAILHESISSEYRKKILGGDKMLSFEDVLKEFEEFLHAATYLEVLPCRWRYVRLFNEGDPLNFYAVLCLTPQELYDTLENDLAVEKEVQNPQRD